MMSKSVFGATGGGRRSMVGFHTNASVEFGGGGGLDAYCVSVTTGSTGCSGSGSGVLIGACLGASLASTRSRSCNPKLSPERLAGGGALAGSGESAAGVVVAMGFGFVSALTTGGDAFATTEGSATVGAIAAIAVGGVDTASPAGASLSGGVNVSRNITGGVSR